jgi:uncharacterized protein YecE (DUF72 family)
LSFYQTKFRTVEVNSSFYRLPSAKTVMDWRKSAPPGFVYAMKASAGITHRKKLKEAEQSVQTFCERITLLADHLGPVLFQLPPHFRCNPDRLQAFLGALPRCCRYALEFRDPSWLNQDIYRILAENQAALGIYEFAGFRSPRHVTADFVYIRLHGPGKAYQGSYDERTLGEWAAAMSAWESQGLEVYCYFDNDEAGYAAQNALTLLEMIA